MQTEFLAHSPTFLFSMPFSHSGRDRFAGFVENALDYWD